MTFKKKYTNHSSLLQNHQFKQKQIETLNKTFNKTLNFNGQILQDKFVLNVLNFKKNGFFIELGSNNPKFINNTYILEKTFNWKGIMIDYDEQWLKEYQKDRPNSIPIINDATHINYKKLFENHNVPLTIDYLQIDLDVDNNTTLNCLHLLDNTILDTYKFATITFEHDIYQDPNKNDDLKNTTRTLSREIFKKRGYVRVFDDLYNDSPNIVFEDWYVSPDLVDMNYIRLLQDKNKNNYIKSKVVDVAKALDGKKIEYLI